MPIDRTRLMITERDKAILLYLFRNKVVSRAQMHKFFFRNASIKAVTQRLGKLSRYGLVKSIYFEKNGNSHRAYTIDKKGVIFISNYLPCEIQENRYKSDALEHDMALSEINFIFENLSMVYDVKTESELQSFGETIDDDGLLPFFEMRSDRAILVDGKNGRKYLALEYERTLKSYSRNRSKFEKYYLQSNIPAVLYICETDTILKSLIQIDENLCKERASKMYFCTMDNIRNYAEGITFQRFDGRQLVFK